jgi:hypothetical protein
MARFVVLTKHRSSRTGHEDPDWFIHETLDDAKRHVERMYAESEQSSYKLSEAIILSVARLNKAGQLMKELEIQVAALKAVIAAHSLPVNGQPQRVTK